MLTLSRTVMYARSAALESASQPGGQTIAHGAKRYAAPCCEVAPGAPTSSIFPLTNTDHPNSKSLAPSDAPTFASKCDVVFQPVDGFINV